VGKSKKGLFGLRQASLSLGNKLSSKMLELRFKLLDAHQSFYYNKEKDLELVAIFVDNLVIATKTAQRSNKVIESCERSFQLTRMEKISKIIG
jgi:Reverse transcriptase (RNA-dependent DNA polymerase)